MRSCVKNHPEPAATAWRCAECSLALSGLPITPKRHGLCSKLGPVARTVECNSCFGRVALKVYPCELLGEATIARPLKGVRGCCDRCKHWVPRLPASDVVGDVAGDLVDSFRRIAPLGTNRKVEGIAPKKPWEYRSTAVIPHLDTLEYLTCLVELLRLQTEAPYIIIVDTGSPFNTCEQLEKLRSADVEIHYIRGNGYSHTSEPVAVALDLGMARANTPRIFLTHTDCFPMRRDALAWLGGQCDAITPVVGWEMSERSWLTDEWKGMVSHTFTMLHAPTMRRVGATWHMGRARDKLGLDAGYRSDGWPDTETGFAYCLRAAGVKVKLLGSEVNYERQITEWWDHARSLTGTNVYSKGTKQGEATAIYASSALLDAKRRAAEWALMRS